MLFRSRLGWAEYKLLRVLLAHPNRVLNRDQLLDLTQGREADPLDRAIDVQISRLRRLIEPDPSKPRPVTFFYNGGPGSSSVFLLLGSFGPKRLQSSFPNFTPPAPYKLPDNPDSLLDRSDLVFINPVGTGYSAAISPAVNKNFWGVDQDAHSIDRFIQRYLTKYSRWNSPKFLFGESYGTARSAVV